MDRRKVKHHIIVRRLVDVLTQITLIMDAVVKSTLAAICFINSCHSQPDFKDEGEGLIELRGNAYDTSTRQYTKEDFFPDMKIWYRGSFVIEEIKTIKTTRNDGNFTHETPIAYYLLMDRNTKMFYHYSSFSDTARLLDQYKLEDTSEMKGVGGWGFYKDINTEIIGPKKYFRDTTIEGVIYKRVHFNVKAGNFVSPTVYYLRCDKKGSLFKFNKRLSEEFGCPVVRIDYLPTPENTIPGSSEIVFVRDKLSKDELKVFDAWEKNIKKQPVSKYR